MNWKRGVTEQMTVHGESWADVESCTLSEDELAVDFDDGFGASCGAPFTLWTKNRVYFPVVYDGSEWVGSVPRNPNGEASTHVGGE